MYIKKMQGGHQFTPADVGHLYEIFDTNKDGKVSYLEFANAVAAANSVKAIDDM